MKRLLVTGASGLLGHTLCRIAAEAFEVTGIYRSHPFELDGVRALRCDLLSYGDLKALLAHVRPDRVIHAAAISQPEVCQEYRDASRRMNVEATANFAGLCADRGIPFLFTSTDLVFDGTRAPYRESDPVSPVSVYAEHKVMAEGVVLDRHPGAVVRRLALMFGDAAPGGASFLQAMIRAMLSETGARLFTDEFRTPLGVEYAARGLLLSDEGGGAGPPLLHLGGPERISRYDLGQLVEDVFELSEARYIGCRLGEVRMKAPRPPDVSLDSSEAAKLGFTTPSLQEQMEKIRDAWKARKAAEEAEASKYMR